MEYFKKYFFGVICPTYHTIKKRNKSAKFKLCKLVSSVWYILMGGPFNKNIKSFCRLCYHIDFIVNTWISLIVFGLLKFVLNNPA